MQTGLPTTCKSLLHIFKPDISKMLQLNVKFAVHKLFSWQGLWWLYRVIKRSKSSLIWGEWRVNFCKTTYSRWFVKVLFLTFLYKCTHQKRRDASHGGCHWLLLSWTTVDEHSLTSTAGFLPQLLPIWKAAQGSCCVIMSQQQICALRKCNMTQGSNMQYFFHQNNKRMSFCWKSASKQSHVSKV